MIKWEFLSGTLWECAYLGEYYRIMLTPGSADGTARAWLWGVRDTVIVRRYQGSVIECQRRARHWQATFLEILMEETL